MSSIKSRVQYLEHNVKSNRKAEPVHFASVHQGRDNTAVLADIAEREANGQRVVIFDIVPPHVRPI